MKNIVIVLAALLSSAVYSKDIYVRGYTKSNGTYVQPYHRSAPDKTINNNYGTSGNYNPYNGSYGTKPQNPYQQGYTGYGNSYDTHDRD